ncbi:MAG: M48 family metalloprotease [Candidatus Micrarchaeota archaeon]|nr:M48 family metalloprotease [Candidatus Micrarchaeota archaeon]
MTSFFDEIAQNRLKSLVLMALFSMFFIAILYLFVLFMGGGGPTSISIAVFLVAIYAIIIFYTGDKLVLTVSRAKEADRKQYRDLYGIIEGLASAIQVPMPKVYIINDPSPNAFATGRSRKVSSVAVTTGLLNIMDRRELSGVLAHEMSHIQDNDIQFMTIAVVFAGAIGIMAAFIRNMLFFGMGGNNRNGGIILLIALVIGLLAPFFALLIRLAISRRREYMADANGARLTRDPHSLSSALKKLLMYEKDPKSVPLQHVNEVTANLFFANPFKAGNIANIFSTHPPLEERIKKLEAMY